MRRNEGALVVEPAALGARAREAALTEGALAEMPVALGARAARMVLPAVKTAMGSELIVCALG